MKLEYIVGKRSISTKVSNSSTSWVVVIRKLLELNMRLVKSNDQHANSNNSKTIMYPN